MNPLTRWMLPGTAMLFSAVNGLGETPPKPEAAMFDLAEIRLLEGTLQRQQELNRQYLLRLEPDRLLSWFRREAGLEPLAPPYRGWESEGRPLPGHILGFYLSGTAMTVQATGDETLKERLGYIVDELARVQEANGSGYMLALKDGKKVFAEIAMGRIEIDGLPWNGYQINGHFEPTYTMNKLMLGLAAVHRATGNEKAKAVFLRLADWFGREIIDKLDDAKLQTLMQCEHGSLPESFVDAWELSGQPVYLKWARRICHERMLNPLADNQRDFITRFHANSNIPKYTAFERLYQATGETKLHRAAENFHDDVAGRRSWVIGGNSANEHFFDPADFKSALSALAGPETCNSVNMLRLGEALFRMDRSAAAMDFYERVLFNHLLSAHDPERGMCCYYTTMRAGGYRVYSDEFDSMWCCTGTGLEVPGKYGQMVFTRSPDNASLDVNLFAAAELKWRERNLTIRQNTRFPKEPGTTLTFSSSGDQPLKLRIRHPRWLAAPQLAVSLNGQSVNVSSKPGGYAEIERTWHDGDVLHVDLPMKLHAENLPGDDHEVALLYGPIVLSGEMGRDGLTKEDFWGIHTTVGTKTLPEDQEPVFIADTAEEVLNALRPVAGKPLHFTTGTLLSGGGEMSLIPFYQNHFQRYVIYWHRRSKAEENAAREKLAAARREAAALDARTVDRVSIGDAASEKDHALAGERTNTGDGAYDREHGTHWRDAANGGWFEYRVRIQTPAPELRFTYWGRERGARTFDVLIDGKRLETRSLGDTGKDEFVHFTLPLPAAMVQGKSAVTVRLQAHPGNSAGGLFDLRSLRRAP